MDLKIALNSFDGSVEGGFGVFFGKASRGCFCVGKEGIDAVELLWRHMRRKKLTVNAVGKNDCRGCNGGGKGSNKLAFI